MSIKNSWHLVGHECNDNKFICMYGEKKVMVVMFMNHSI